MTQQKNRIARFIESLSIENESMDLQSAVLTTDLDFVGAGDTNGGNCINETYSSCHKSKNGGACQNYNDVCADSTNKSTCLNTAKKNLGGGGNLPKPDLP